MNRTAIGNTVVHQGKPWQVTKILIYGRDAKPGSGAIKSYVRACPVHDGQVLTRSERTIGDEWV